MEILKGIKLIIFDFDGVIMDSEKLHYDKFCQVIARYGEKLDWEEYKEKYLALSDHDCFIALLKDRGWSFDPALEITGGKRILTQKLLDEMCGEKEKLFKSAMKTELKPIPGTLDFIRWASLNYRLAIASGAIRPEIEEPLRQQGIFELFEVIVAAGDAAQGKPHPEPFLKALELVNGKNGTSITPGECVVIEDSVHGVEGAKKAGMKCIALTTSYPAEMLKKADIAIERLILNY